MSILRRLFGGMRPSGPTATVRELFVARVPPWNKVHPDITELMLAKLDGTGLLDSFVNASMTHNLIPSYTAIDPMQSSDIAAAQISQILCQSGMRDVGRLAEARSRNHSKGIHEFAFSATNQLEPAILFSKDQIAAYLGMAQVYDLLSVGREKLEWATKGLRRLEKLKAYENVLPGYAYKQLEDSLSELIASS